MRFSISFFAFSADCNASSIFLFLLSTESRIGFHANFFKININNIYCTKIASKLVRTYTDKHGYKDLCKELLNKNISKVEQSSDWGGELTKDQQKYAATDVLYLHKIKKKLEKEMVG